MGACCTSNVNLIGEQFIRDILQTESLNLRSMDYMDLLNEIVSKRVEQEIPKNHIKEYIIPDVYDPAKNMSNDIYVQPIFTYILSQLNEKSNMYIVLLYFYPFIKHDKEKTYDNFFNCLRYVTQSLLLQIDQNDVFTWLLKYISFCTYGVTSAVNSVIQTSDDVSISLNEIIKGPFSENNIVKFVKKLMNVMTEGNKGDLITCEMFKKLFNEYDISTIENVRDFVLQES